MTSGEQAFSQFSDALREDTSKRVTVTKSGEGWELREERDHEIVRSASYTDWHRVERAIELLRLQGYAIDPARRIA